MMHQHGFLLSFRSFRRGFTLVEIILVVVIILTLAAVVGPRLVGQGKAAKIRITKIQIESLKNDLGRFELHAGRFPTTQEGLAALLTKPSDLKDSQWEGPYTDKLPADGFSVPFKYKCPPEKGRDYDLISSGPDEKLGSQDDITNFEDNSIIS